MLLELLVRGVVVVVVALLIVTAFMYFTQRGSMYFPWTGPIEPPPPGVEAIELATDDGLQLAAWFVPAAGAGQNTEPGPAVLVCNGNAGYRAHRLPLAEALAERGYHVLLFDYRGYAGNPGTPTEDGLRADARSAARALAGRAEVDAQRVAYFGESLGASVCGGLAAELPPAALVLRSPFPSTVEIGRHHYPYLPVIEPLVWDRFPLAQQLADEVRAPLLVLVGERDEIVPPHLSRRAYEAAASEPKRWVVLAAAHHNDEVLLDGEELLAEVGAFLEEHLGDERPLVPRL
jgi:fermentation-respiration switch protein FrsA (DUF1100 family)